MSKVIKLKTLYKLGVFNILRVVVYRASLKFKYSAIRLIRAEFISGDFFREDHFIDISNELSTFDGWCNGRTYYSFHHVEDDRIPNWHRHPFTGKVATSGNSPWWQIPDFDPDVGDIKSIWESSRFDWVLGFAQHGISNPKYIVMLNSWLADWCNNNQPYLGINWKCGQEASIRLIHLCLAAKILGQHNKPEPALIRLIEVHLKRIKPTISYAVAQNNNHGTSEAAALYICGSWLAGLNIQAGKEYERLGLKWLKNRADKLILDDGTFSQYSVNYHRLMLDTYSIVEVWRMEMNLKPFNKNLYRKLKLATNWLYEFTNVENGDAPNLGANDGSMLLPLGSASYRDFRPSIQLASALFCKKAAYSGEGVWNNYLDWLQLSRPIYHSNTHASRSMEFGGYELLRNSDFFAVFNIPKNLFRPGQSDILHIDLWHKGKNILRDAGSFSYNCDRMIQNYFKGVQSHNTIQFDHRDQMLKLSRFLYGPWVKCDKIEALKTTANKVTSSASYTDYKGASHYRSLQLTPLGLTVIDSVANFKSSAILRWRLIPGDWLIDNDNLSISTDEYIIQIECTSDVERFELVAGMESHFYQDKTELPVLEIEVNESCQFKSKIELIL